MPAPHQRLRSDRSLPSGARRAIGEMIDELEYLRQSLAEAYRQIAELENLADMDSLVPALNRRAFMRQLKRTISFSERYGAANSVLYVDVNGMKGINDTLGHSAGDAALVQIVDTVNRSVRQSDVVGRLGGDEFGVILIQTTFEEAQEKADRLSQAIRTSPLYWENQTVILDAAIGVHTIRTEDTARGVLAAADAAMYEDKRSGRPEARIARRA